MKISLDFLKHCFKNNTKQILFFKSNYITLKKVFQFSIHTQKQNGKSVIQFHEKMLRQEFLRPVLQLLEVFPPVIELFMGFWPFFAKNMHFSASL